LIITVPVHYLWIIMRSLFISIDLYPLLILRGCYIKGHSIYRIITIASATFFTDMSWLNFRNYLGNVTPLNILFKRDTAECMVFFSLFHRIDCSLCNRYIIVQCIRRGQCITSFFSSLAAKQLYFPRCISIRHIYVRGSIHHNCSN